MVDFGRLTIGSPPLVWTIQFLYEFLTYRVIWADSFSDAVVATVSCSVLVHLLV